MAQEAPFVPALDASNLDPERGTKYEFPRDLRGYGRHPPNPRWPGGAKVAVSFVVNYEEGSERTVLNGDDRSEEILSELIYKRQGERNLGTESDYEYGSRVGIWRLLDLFESFDMPITAYAIGQALEMNPDVVKALKDGGHEIASHGYRCIDYHHMPAEIEKQYIVRQLEVFRKLTGEFPGGWYVGRQSPRTKALIWEVYKEHGAPLLWESDSYCDDLPYWVDVPAEKDAKEPEGMLMLPYSFDNNDLKFHSGAGAFTPDAFFQYLRASLDTLLAEAESGSPKMMSIGLHCRIIGKPGRSQGLKKFLEYIQLLPKGDVWVTRRMDIATHWRKRFPYKPGHL
nr:hypothetical protein B0A51_11790 [Rachicladosporium sp. CCFEE 5018]